MFEAIAIAAVSTAVLGLVAAQAWRQRNELGRLWLEAAESCGLQRVVLYRRAGWVSHLEGGRGPLAVRLGFVRADDLARPGTRIVVEGLRPDLELRRTDTLAPFERLTTSLPIGDDAFDGMLSVEGDRKYVLSVLDAATRGKARELFADRVVEDVSASLRRGLKPAARVANGRLVVDTYQGIEPPLEPLLGLVLTFAEALTASGPLEPRLAENARRDPAPAVRLANLRELAGARRHPAALEALRAALADGDEQVQLEAAVALGSEGREVLLEIAHREWSADACAARAVEELRSALPVEQARRILGYALRTRRLETARACVESLSRRGPDDADTFARILAIEGGALAAAAARALGRVGGVASVPALADAQRRLGRDDEVRKAVRDAIAAIQSRALGARPGQLALADDQAGKLSLPGDEAGRVSLEPHD